MSTHLASGRRDDTGELDAADRAVLDMLEETLEYARTRDYTGWDYGDGMSSRILQRLPIENKWVNIAFQETAKRTPINIRPLLLVEQHRNYKGTALFEMANQTAATLPTTRDVDYREEAMTLANWLVENRTRGYAGYCASYPHPVQHLDGRGDPFKPDIINTSFGVRALLAAGALDPRFPEVAETAPAFVVNDLHFRPAESGRGAVIDYHTKHPEDHYTINAGAVCAQMLVNCYAQFGTEADLDRATQLLDHIADLQTDLGGWKYRDPPSASHLSMDTHHNGYVIEAFQRYTQVTGSDRYDDVLERALPFFRNVLFDDDGAPNFDERSAFPRDIHASTQGVLVFTYAGDLEFARKILQWVFDNLHAGDGQFYYRRERFFTRRVTLMRWCQAWMAFAMSEYLAARLSPGE